MKALSSWTRRTGPCRSCRLCALWNVTAARTGPSRRSEGRLRFPSCPQRRRPTFRKPPYFREWIGMRPSITRHLPGTSMLAEEEGRGSNLPLAPHQDRHRRKLQGQLSSVESSINIMKVRTRISRWQSLDGHADTGKSCTRALIAFCFACRFRLGIFAGSK